MNGIEVTSDEWLNHIHKHEGVYFVGRGDKITVQVSSKGEIAYVVYELSGLAKYFIIK